MQLSVRNKYLFSKKGNKNKRLYQASDYFIG